ncbi:hypothetical protein B0H10DRAFT_1966230 [Mycena sp. CBHHK59/15]|nr:hypothetical protein B0H10DRAFT_1966230 [Mycena sp. CBHHK59/15]
MEHRRLQMQPEHTPVTVLEEDSDSDETKEELKTEDEGENSDNENDVDKEDISSGDERRTTRSRTTTSQLPPKNGQTSTASEDEDEELVMRISRDSTRRTSISSYLGWVQYNTTHDMMRDGSSLFKRLESAHTSPGLVVVPRMLRLTEVGGSLHRVPLFERDVG